MATAVAGGIVSSVLPRLMSMIDGDWQLRKGLQDDLRNIKQELEAIDAFIKENSELAPESWIRAQLQELAYDIEDCIDRFVGRITCDSEAPLPRRALHRVRTVRARTQFAKEIKKLEKRALQAKSRMEQYGVKPGGVARPAAIPYIPNCDELDITKETEGVLLELLEEQTKMDLDHPSTKQLRVISVVGCDGSGKTTLAKQVYNSQKAEEFSCRAWVDASKNNATGLLKDLLGQVAKTKNIEDHSNCWEHISDEAQLSKILRELLQDERYLVVIDDMKTRVWDTIQSAFPDDKGTNGRIIVTTSMGTVASNCSAHGGFVYKMQALDKVRSEDLLLKVVFGSHKSRCTADFRDGSQSVLRKCDGLPLALVSFARFLKPKARDMTVNEIHDVCTQLGHLLEKDQCFQSMNLALEESYNTLPSHDLKTCLLSVSIFPEGHLIKRKSLVRRWIAEGLVAEDDKERMANDYFDMLVDRNVIQPLDISNDSKVKTCQVHGVMLDFLVHKSVNDNYINLICNGRLRKKRNITTRRLSIYNTNAVGGGIFSKDGIFSKEINFSHIRSLAIFDNADRDFMGIRKCKLLRVLDVENCRGLTGTVLEEICKLSLLRYLSLRSTDVVKIPQKISKLQCLKTLDMRGQHGANNYPIYLPVEVLTLPQLAHLFGQFELPTELNDAATFSKRLKKFFTERSKLQTLVGFDMDKSPGFENIMLHMSRLMKVKIWSGTGSRPGSGASSPSSELTEILVSCLEKRFFRNKALDSLSIDFGGLSIDFLFFLKTPCVCRSIKLRGKLSIQPATFIAFLSDIVELRLFSVGLGSQDLSALQKLRLLRYLKLFEDRQEFGNGSFHVQKDGFQSLKQLCFRAPKLPRVSIEEGAMRHLTSLQLFSADVDDFPSTNIKHLQDLEEVTLHDCVGDRTKQAWEAEAKRHINRPAVKISRPAENASTSR